MTINDPYSLIYDLKKNLDEPIQAIMKSDEWIKKRAAWNMRSLTGLTALGKHKQTIQKAGINVATEAVSHLATQASSGHAAGASTAGIGIGAGLSFGGIGAALAPWVAAARIAATYRHDINRNDLHDVSPQHGYQKSPFPCSSTCKSQPDGKTECDLAIKWLIDRNEIDLAVFGLSTFLAGVPSLAKLAYRKARNQYKKLKFASVAGKSYPEPATGKVWQPDSKNCNDCGKTLSSAMAIHKVESKSRHHCRLCGENYCSDCCFAKVAVFKPLEKGGQSKELKEGCLVCNRCISIALQNQEELSSYATAPLRRANILKNNAMPKQTTPGCKRAQAAIYTIYNGDIIATLIAIIAFDGAEDIVRKLEM